jgi:hypothetical protein
MRLSGLVSHRIRRTFKDHQYLDAHHGQPRPSSEQPDYTLQGHQPHRYAGTDDERGTDQTLDANRLTLMCRRRQAGGEAADPAASSS